MPSRAKSHKTKSAAQGKLFSGARDAEPESESPAPKLFPPTPDDADAFVPQSREEVGAAVCAKRNIVQVASDLLAGGGDPKTAAVRLRAWHSVVDSLFGKVSRDDDDEQPPEIVLDGLPQPERNPIQGE